MRAIREASAADTDVLVALINRAYEIEKFFVEGDRVSRSDVAAALARGVFLVGQQDGAVAACVYVETKGDRAYFGLLAVDPNRQGHGWGREMVEAAEQHARSAGCVVMDLSVVNLRTELPPFYHRLGYLETGTAPFTDQRATQPCHFVLMSKSLEEA
jgi:N-acetylglutamate synthase-like GNAT family acetyltransferase